MRELQVYKLIEELDNKSLLIIDIDSTLVQTHQRNQAIIDEFCRENEAKYPKDVEQLRKMECRPNDYGYYSALERHDVSFTSNKIEEILQKYWRQRFFASDYLHHDLAIAGAEDFLKTIAKKNLNFVYLTGRYHEPMIAGTRSSFQKLNFPFTDEQLILKKDPKEKDELYKSRVINQLKSDFNRTILIDNEPVILQQMIIDHPEVELIWFKSTHSGRKQPPENGFFIDSFLN